MSLKYLVSEAASFLRLIDWCITQLKAQGPSQARPVSKITKKKKKHLLPTRCFVIGRTLSISRIQIAPTRAEHHTLFPLSRARSLSHSFFGQSGLFAGNKHTPCQKEREKELLRRNVKRFRGGLVFKAHRHVYNSTLGLRVIHKKKEPARAPDGAAWATLLLFFITLKPSVE